MTTIITTIIITLVAHSAIGCVLYLATKNNEGVLAYWGAGILCLFTNAITAIIYGIRKITHRKYFKALLVDEEGKLCGDVEFENAMYLAKKRYERVKNEDRNKIYQKISQHLAYKGFNYDIIKRVLNKLLNFDEFDY